MFVDNEYYMLRPHVGVGLPSCSSVNARISDGKAGHYVDVLRQQLMCSADIGLVGYSLVKEYGLPNA